MLCPNNIFFNFIIRYFLSIPAIDPKNDFFILSHIASLRCLPGISLSTFFQQIFILLANPINIIILFGAVLLGIIFGAMPGLTATLGVGLLTTLTYGMDTSTSMVALLSIYVGAIYGGSYSSILINIPGTAAAAATALDGYPLACQGKA